MGFLLNEQILDLQPSPEDTCFTSLKPAFCYIERPWAILLLLTTQTTTPWCQAPTTISRGTFNSSCSECRPVNSSGRPTAARKGVLKAASATTKAQPARLPSSKFLTLRLVPHFDRLVQLVHATTSITHPEKADSNHL